MKKLINNPRNIVREMLEGQADLSPGQALLDAEDVIVRADLPAREARRVALISGGGSGHEPAHAGYVGEGLLTAAVAGDVFTSPSVDAILAAIRVAAGPAGVVLIVKNYTGDRLNFGLAAELAKQEGIPAEIVVVADDVALQGIVEPARRRGIAGTVLIHKVAGAAAEAGKSVTEVAALARAAAAELGSMGVALGSCTVPTAGKPGFELGEDEIELGLGIHGEKGVERTQIKPVDQLVDTILDAITRDRGLKAGAKVALLVNGLGATPPMELAIVARRALAHLRGKGITVAWAQTGDFLTALEMPGCSLSVLRLDDERLALLEAPAKAPAWMGSGLIPAKRHVVAAPPAAKPTEAVAPGPLAGVLKQAALAVAAAFDAAEAHLTDLDARTGDGDLGASMVRGAEAIRALPEGAWGTPASALSAMGDGLRRNIAGSSGPFYATALLRAAGRLAGQPQPDAKAWDEAFATGIASVGEIGGAKPGDRTMLDALDPALNAWMAARKAGKPAAAAWAAAVTAAETGAAATSEMMPKLGRASYLGARALGSPDGGAVAITVWMKALAPFIR
ncbi:dihydroxyacetone kinase family protein [Bosea sp. 124]|uniref:dihydroxyacetone kinase family protein n=1 Tax=Bosea sp. 124 TaxID=2135642 RepID=UPI000D38DAFB|nr:dihydroxyacetone kinase family protein [Bosea sp. 124]PTM43431.1 homodimeric dihydroxyacetone kinase [Bosea sp. 124]